MNRFMTFINPCKLIRYRFVATKLTADGKEIPKKKIVENRVTLIGADDTVSIVDLKNAQNISLRRDLKLVKIQDVDAKTRRPIYKLMSNAEYHKEELEKRKEIKASKEASNIKGNKLLSLSSKIGEHDLMTGIKKMLKLLQKHYEIRVIISREGGEETQSSERILSLIEKNIKSDGEVINKTNKGNSLRFLLRPLKRASTNSNNNVDSTKSNNNSGPL